MKITLESLQELRKNFIQSQNPVNDFKDENVQISHISDIEMIDRINSGELKLHPIYPIIVNYNGTELYDIRDNFRIIVSNANKRSRKRKTCCVLGYGRKILARIVAESWYNRILNDDESVHHIDNNRDNDDYRNLQILDNIKHLELHGYYNESKDKNMSNKLNVIYNNKWLNNLRAKYPLIKKHDIKNISKDYNISDNDLLLKLNSRKFSLHPKYPIIIDKTGKHIYDIRNNAKIMPAHRKCVIPMYDTVDLSLLILEAWSNRLLNKNETIYYKDNNIHNINYYNLKITKKSGYLSQFNSLEDFVDINDVIE